jgi:murein DD-endopeptidase MepM/ murein hydrolase activator NlpD
VLQPFSLGDDPYEGGRHRGIDVAGVTGASVPAPAAGIVAFAGTTPANGRSVTIETADGYAVTLVHLGSIGVTEGQSVGEGEPVGSIGPSGDAEHASPYIHLGIRTVADENGYLDPLQFLPVREEHSPPAPPAEPPLPEAVTDDQQAPAGAEEGGVPEPTPPATTSEEPVAAVEPVASSPVEPPTPAETDAVSTEPEPEAPPQPSEPRAASSELAPVPILQARTETAPPTRPHPAPVPRPRRAVELPAEAAPPVSSQGEPVRTEPASGPVRAPAGRRGHPVEERVRSRARGPDRVAAPRPRPLRYVDGRNAGPATSATAGAVSAPAPLGSPDRLVWPVARTPAPTSDRERRPAGPPLAALVIGATLLVAAAFAAGRRARPPGGGPIPAPAHPRDGEPPASAPADPFDAEDRRLAEALDRELERILVQAEKGRSPVS